MVTLEASRLFCQLSAAELKALRSIAHERRFSAGQPVFKEGDNGDGLFVVKDGLVEISALVGKDVRRVFSRVGPGEIFGEMAVVECKPRSANAVAAAATEVYFISRDEILILVERSPVLALALLREISQRLREFDRQYLREVLQAERLAVLGRFARSIVHDLKNPLNIIGLTAEMAIMDQVNPEFRRQATERIRKQVERISDMVGEILEFTEASPSACVLAPADYGAFVRQLVEELRPEAALRSATLELEAALPAVHLLLNPKRLRRVFYNLVHNATDAMPDGGRILVRSTRAPNAVVTEIEDSGPGIPPEMDGRLFEAFATYGKAHGTGLGLSICKRIIEDHQGWITARTEPGRGAIFSFGLPLPKK